MSEGAPRFALNPALDVAALAAEYRATRRVSISDFLAGDAAARLYAHLRGREDWRQVVNSGDKVFELDRATRAGMPPAQSAALDEAVHAGARAGFQHRYEAIRVPDERAPLIAQGGPLAGFARFLSEGTAREMLRGITGASDIDFADAQATAYSPGDFLTGHDDAVAGKHRRAAYVFGLTPDWRPEFGGLLLFHEADGTVRGLVPAFNRLNLFAVPQVHSVSYVTPAAPYRRYAITGWLRAVA